MSLLAYEVCGHCNQLLSEKALKEHHRLYLDEEKGVWVKLSEESDDSLASSPLGLSPPGSDALDVESVDQSFSQSSTEQPFEDNDMIVAAEDPAAPESCRFKNYPV